LTVTREKEEEKPSSLSRGLVPDDPGSFTWQNVISLTIKPKGDVL